MFLSGLVGLELLFFLGHGSGLDLDHSALGDDLILTMRSFEMIVGAFEFWLVGGGDLSPIG